MPTEDAKTLLDKILRDWSLMDVGDERHTQSRREALTPLQGWLSSGEQSPEVVIRAIQALVADPDAIGMDQRPAVGEVLRSVAPTWATAGSGPRGMNGLQALLLAAWPRAQVSGWFKLAPLLDSAWLAVRHPERHLKWIESWRQEISRPASQPSTIQAFTASKTSPPKLITEMSTTEVDNNIAHIKQYANHNAYSLVSNSLIAIMQALQNDIMEISGALTSLTNYTVKSQQETSSQIQSQLDHILKNNLSTLTTQQELLWWGQARYSQAVGKPYRRIKTENERLWWMAVEASSLAGDIEILPAASYLMETLHQVDGDIDSERTLKEWMLELFRTLRQLRENKQYAATDAMKLSPLLQKLVQEDSLGLPVSWVHHQAISTTNGEADFEERAKEQVGLDLKTSIDRGEWAAWIFRESLLNRHLAGVK